MASGKDFFSLDEANVKRLQREHKWRMQNNNKITLAPVDLKQKGLRILDLGCVDGTVLRDLQAQLTEPKLTGVDFHSTWFPKDSAGIRYMTHDAHQPFPADLQGAFDTFKEIVSILAETVAPGGYLEVFEPLIDPTHEAHGSVMAKIVTPLQPKLFEKVSISDIGEQLKEAFIDTGLEDVKVTKVEDLIGAKSAHSQDLELSGVLPIADATPRILQAATVFGLDAPENLHQLIEDEYKTVGGVILSVNVTGRKPLS